MKENGKSTFIVQCPGVYHDPSPVPNPGSSSRVCLHHVLFTNTFVNGQPVFPVLFLFCGVLAWERRETGLC